MAELRTETMTVNMGPQHPSTHGVLRLVLELDGETVVSVSPTIGFLHTGIEKTAEQKKWQQVIPLVERMDYLGAQSNSFAYCLSVEKLLGLEVPQRVKDIRVLIAELQRLSSHLVWFGTHGMEIGAITVMLYAFREREILMNLNEMLAGFRFFPSYIRVGGLREDLPAGPLRYGSLFEAFPFDNKVGFATLRGADLVKLLTEHMRQKGGVLSVSGIRVRAACRGADLKVEVTYDDGKPVGDADTITLLASDFMLTGGDSFWGSVHPSAPTLEDALVRDVLEAGLKKRSEIDPSALVDEKNPRMSFPGTRPVRCP